MAQKRSELGKKINEVRKTIKQKTISDQMGQGEAAKIFEPITSGLRDLTVPKAPLRKLKKKRPVPDYGLEIGDDEEVPDYGLEDLFGEQVLPQNDKQVVPKLPSYEDVLKELASGEEKIHLYPEYMKESDDLPPEYEEDGPNYEMLEDDIINPTLDELSLPKYHDIETYINQEKTSDTDRKKFLNKIFQTAKNRRTQLPGYSAHITKELNKGSISEAEAQYRRKVISDARKI